MRPEKALLSGVGGAVRSGDRRGDAYRGALVPADEIVVRVTIAGLGPPDPVCVVQDTSRLVSLSPHLHDGKPGGSHRRRLPDPGEAQLVDTKVRAEADLATPTSLITAGPPLTASAAQPIRTIPAALSQATS